VISWNNVDDPDSFDNLAEVPATRVDMIQLECQDSRNHGDCVAGQKWKCEHDGFR
jgi:hypothetical protein